MLTTTTLLALVLAVPAVAGGSWVDCSADEKISNPTLKFSAVASSPDPVTKSANQTITKTVHNTGTTDLANITAHLEQYWKVQNKTWVKFLGIDTDFCAEHAGACPLAAGKSVVATTVHPPLHWGTPYGWYRSKQTYRDTVSGKLLGCVDMRFDYCASADKCKYS